MSHSRPARKRQTLLLPTLMDRLVDERPDQQTELPQDYAVDAARMRQIVRRDLTHLLSTINLSDLLNPLRHEAVCASVLNYGVPAFAGTFSASRDWTVVRRALELAVRRFEPRLLPDSVRVLPRSNGQGKGDYNTLSFEIHGLLHMQPYPLEFMVQSVLDLETGQVALQ